MARDLRDLLIIQLLMLEWMQNIRHCLSFGDIFNHTSFGIGDVSFGLGFSDSYVYEIDRMRNKNKICVHSLLGPAHSIE